MNFVRQIAGVILLLVAGQVMFPSRGECAMNFDRVEYTIATMEEAPQVLVVEADGKATCEAHSNMYSQKDPQIGTYQTTLTPAQLQELNAALSEPPFDSVPDHWGKVAPAEYYQRIRVVSGAKTIEKLVTPRLPIDPRMQAVLKLLDQITAKVKSHPLRTLAIQITRCELKGHSLRIVFALTNSGKDPIIIRSPVALIKASDGALEVQAWPDRKDVRADEVKHIAVESLKSALPESAGPLEIKPEVSRPYGLVGEVDLPAAPYVARVEYRSVKKEWDGAKLLYGELLAVPEKITVVAAGAAQ